MNKSARRLAHRYPPVAACSAAIASALALCAPQAAAFSLDTHLYIATKVLDDARTGTVSVCAGEALSSAQPGTPCARRYPIPPALAAALQSNPSAYLAGALGPDVFPDFLTPQVSIHPGVNKGWGTDDFLKHLLSRAGSSAELAWVNGFMSHASADVFAHSWVNIYAGGIFDLAKHIDSNEIEERHFVLERYIADRTPRIWAKYAAQPSAPHEFVADELILANPVSAQYKKASGATSHIVAIEVVHENAKKLYEDALAIARSATAIGLKTLVPLDSAKLQLKLAEEALKLGVKGLDESLNLLKKRDELIKGAEDTLLDAAKIIDENPSKILGWQQQLSATKLALDAQESGLEGLRGAVRTANNVVNEAQRVLDNVNRLTCWQEKIFGFLGSWVKNLCKINPAYVGAEASLNAAREILRGHERVLNEALNAVAALKRSADDLQGLIDQADRALAEARITQTAVRAQLAIHRAQRDLESEGVKAARRTVDEARKASEQAQALVDKLGRELAPVIDLLARLNPIVLFLQHWAADVRRASIAFSGASQEVAANIIDKQAGNALEPYINWYQCWSPVLAAIPSEVPQTVCTAKEVYGNVRDRLMGEIDKVVDSMGSLGWLVAPGVKMKQEFEKKVKKPLENEAKKAVGRAAIEIVAFLANRQLADLLALMSSKDRITDARLNSIYQSDDSHKRLLEIGDVAARARLDAGLTSEADTVSEDKFAALYNAIVLSKLALLDADTLNAVHNDLTLDAQPDAKPRQVFSALPGQPFNILLGGVSSIDGNHQWQAVGLPYPVSSGTSAGWPDSSRYGRPGSGGTHSGFLLWGDVGARQAAFAKLFRGPISPGMDSHPIMVASYPFPACAQHPFPSTTSLDGEPVASDFTCRILSEDPSKSGLYSSLSERKSKRAELAQLSLPELRIARNEIFARHGYRFGKGQLGEHFRAQPWYQASDLPTRQIYAKVTLIEWRNVRLLKQSEWRLRSQRPQ